MCLCCLSFCSVSCFLFIVISMYVSAPLVCLSLLYVYVCLFVFVAGGLPPSWALHMLLLRLRILTWLLIWILVLSILLLLLILCSLLIGWPLSQALYYTLLYYTILYSTPLYSTIGYILYTICHILYTIYDIRWYDILSTTYYKRYTIILINNINTYIHIYICIYIYIYIHIMYIHICI